MPESPGHLVAFIQWHCTIVSGLEDPCLDDYLKEREEQQAICASCTASVVSLPSENPAILVSLSECNIIYCADCLQRWILLGGNKCRGYGIEWFTLAPETVTALTITNELVDLEEYAKKAIEARDKALETRLRAIVGMNSGGIGDKRDGSRSNTTEKSSGSSSRNSNPTPASALQPAQGHLEELMRDVVEAMRGLNTRGDAKDIARRTGRRYDRLMDKWRAKYPSLARKAEDEILKTLVTSRRLITAMIQ